MSINLATDKGPDDQNSLIIRGLKLAVQRYEESMMTASKKSDDYARAMRRRNFTREIIDEFQRAPRS